MKTKTLFITGLIFVFCVILVKPSQAQVIAFDYDLEFKTIDKGEISYYRYNDDSFTGADLLIKDKNTWKYFWSQHSEGLQPRPSLPIINFKKEMVIVTILGIQSSGGGPSTEVLEINTQDTCRCLTVFIKENTTPGPLDVITNPYHIIKLRRSHIPSIVFDHQEPLKGSY